MFKSTETILVQPTRERWSGLNFLKSYNKRVESLLGQPMLSTQSVEEKKFSKDLLQWVALACMICGVVWSAFITYHLGFCITSLIPLSFSVIVTPFYIYNKLYDTDNMLAKVQSLAIIFVPWGIQMSLGSYASGMVILWGILGPLCGLFFLTKRSAIRLFLVYLINACVAICTDTQLTNDAANASKDFVSVFYAMNISLPSFVVFSALWYTFSKLGTQRRKVRHLLDETSLRNKDLTDSISYAEHLQNAVLPSFDEFQQTFESSFLYYRPKDIVSGDFFWKKHVGHRYYFAVCDSTGHGVPGSLVSFICSRALDEAIEKYKFTDPGAILAKCRELVIQSFTHSDKLIKDGMDIGLCCLDKDMLLFSGARHSLYVLRGSGTIEEVKGTRQSVGYSMTNNLFTTHVLRKKSISRVFLTTDGFIDQFGGSQNKKFKANRFKQLLNKTSKLPITKQEKILEKIMQDWMQGYEQIDDMCVLGVDLQTTEVQNVISPHPSIEAS